MTANAEPFGSWPALMAATCAASLGGATIVATRMIASGLDPLTLSLLRYGGATACLAPLALVLTRPKKRMPLRDVLAIGGLGLFYFGLFPWLFTAALMRTTAAHGALFVSLTPMLTLLLAGALGYEQITARKLLGVVLAVAGVGSGVAEELSVAAPGENGAWTGDSLMLLGACISACYGVMSRPFITRYSALLIIASGMAAGSLGLLAVALLENLPIVPELTGWQWSLVVFLAVPGCAGAFYLLIWAYGKTAPTRVAIFLTLNPIVAMLAGSAFLEEPLSTLQLAGLGLVVGGIGVVSLPVPALERTAVRSSTGIHAGKSSA